jgi:hypothetical protein
LAGGALEAGLVWENPLLLLSAPEQIGFL